MGYRLDAYLARIGKPDAGAADLATLRAVVAGHAQAIAFENLDAFTGRTPRLDPDDLAAKLVAGGRGGWCFEQNLLLRGALDDLGFRTTGLAGSGGLGPPGRGADAAARAHAAAGRAGRGAARRGRRVRRADASPGCWRSSPSGRRPPRTSRSGCGRTEPGS